MEIKHAYIELTKKCNLKCEFCYNNSGNKDYELNIDNVKSLIKHLKNNYRTNEISLSGGEPCLYTNVKELVEFINDEKIDITLVTNGTLLNKINPDILSIIKNIQISLEGKKESNDALRGKGVFDLIHKSVCYLLMNNLINKVRIRTTLNKINKNDIEYLINYCINNKIKKISFGVIRNQGRTISKWNNLALSNEEIYELKYKIDSYRKKYERDLEIGIFDVDGGNCSLTNDKINLNLRVDADGFFYTCHGFTDKKFSFGNINDNDFSCFDEGSKLFDLINTFKKRKDSLLKCKKCIWKKVSCQGGCPASAFNNYGTIDNLDGNCFLRVKFWKDNFIESKKKGGVIE